MLAPASRVRALSSLFPQSTAVRELARLEARQTRSLWSSRTLSFARDLSRTNNPLPQASIRTRAQPQTHNPLWQAFITAQSQTKHSLWHPPTRAQSNSSASGAPDESTMGKTVKVDVTSDTVCPWCFVGKKNLEAAIQQLPGGIYVEVTWRPFQLNPSAPKEGVSKEQLYREKFGPRVPAMMERMSGIFAGFGHKISLGGLTGNTLDSHRLLWWARHGPQGSTGKQNALAEELFLDYFTREKYIGDRDVLAAAAERVGLTGAKKFLDDPVAGVKEVQQELREYGRGVTGVPYFRVAGQELSGAQPPEVLAEALLQAAS